MSVIYQTTITRIGDSAADALSDNMLITFREGAPADVAEFCFIHNHGALSGALLPGAQFELGEQHYPVTAVATSPNRIYVSLAISPCVLMGKRRRNTPERYMSQARCRTLSPPAAF
ncbi:PTS system, glucitol/sorbitol-specific IIA component (EC [Kosakonia radicincitans]|nr:PTS system, glucitol/sorbitol-specific IIA component (EC [Kosakonia radicincitans]